MVADSGQQKQDPPETLIADIAAVFDRLELPHWAPVVSAWLERYDGISHCYFEDETGSPALEVLRCISSLEVGAIDSEVAAGLSQLEFLSWRVRHPESGERWDPLALVLGEFIGGNLPPDCWKWEGAYPSSEAIASWLLEQLPQR